MTRTIVIGDVHGCLEELRELLYKRLSATTQDRIIFLGDLIDRGPDPSGVVALAHQIGAIGTMGNHEEKALRWRRHEQKRKADPAHYKNPMNKLNEDRIAQWNTIPDEHWAWLASWPAYIRINETWVGVHAGCMPFVELEKQIPNELMRLRYVKTIMTPHGYPKYKMAPLDARGEPEPGVTHWTDLWEGPESIVYGHYVWDEVHETVHPDNGVKTIGIDTGCVHGGELTALVFMSGSYWHLISVKAHQVYSERKPWNEE